MLIVSLNDKSKLNILNTLVDGIVVYTNDFSSFYNVSYTLEDILDIYENRGNLKVFIDLSIMCENKDINAISLFLDKLEGKEFYFIYSDLGIHQLLKDKGLENRGIYNPHTLITNQYDAAFYLKDNMLSCAVSLEIPVSDQKIISEYNNHNIFLKSFGYHQMFYSKRHLLTLYKEHKNLDYKIDNQNSYLREIKRENDFFHVYETNKGTILFRNYIINYLDSLDIINPRFIFLDNIFIANEIFDKVILIYSNYLNKIITKEDAIKEICALNLDTKDEFKYKDSVYQKEEF